MADDFKYLFPTVKNDLYLKWDSFCKEILFIYESIKDPACMDALKALQNPNLKPGKNYSLENPILIL